MKASWIYLLPLSRWPAPRQSSSKTTKRNPGDIAGYGPTDVVTKVKSSVVARIGFSLVELALPRYYYVVYNIVKLFFPSVT